jgi:hypothetical protein
LSQLNLNEDRICKEGECRLCERLLFSVDHQVAAVLAAAALSVLSPAERPDSPLLVAPAIKAAPAILSTPPIFTAPSINRSPAVFSGATLWNVGGVGEMSSVDTRSASAIVSKAKFDGVNHHNQVPRQKNVIGYSLFVNRDTIAISA